MTDVHDHDLLGEYSRHGSEPAFRTLVERYVNLVYSAALRVTRNSHDAEEVTQAVFVVLARKAGSLRPGTIMAGWLYQTAHHTAANLVRGKIRRQRREQEATMQSSMNEPSDVVWEQIAPMLEESLALLGETDRNALVLRFFQNKTNREVGAALRVTEAAAHQRVSRALEKLRKIFAKRGVVLGTAAIAGALSANSVQAAPAGLAGTAVGMGMGTGTAAASVAGLAGQILRGMKWSRITWGVVAGVGIAVVVMVISIAVGNRHAAGPGRVTPSDPGSTTTSASLAQANAPATNYDLIQIEPIPGFDLHIAALNNRGQIVGSLDSTNHETFSFLWDGGVLTNLGTFGGSKSLATGINDAGDIVGLLLTNGARHVFLRHNGEVSVLGILDHFAKLGDEGDKYQGGPGIIYYAPRVAINGLSQVTGRLMDQRDNPHSFLFDQGTTSFFGLIGDGNRFEAEAINVRGQILGRATQGRGTMRSMLWQNGELIDLASLDGTSSGAAAINDRGMVVGSLAIANGLWQAFSWENGQVRRLPMGTNRNTSASAINNAGLVVGSAWNPSRSFACLWYGEEIVDLNDLVKIESGWRLTSASAINDRGQILAWATKGREHRDYLLSPGSLRPLLEEPIPPPAVPPPKNVAIEPFNLSSFERLPRGAFRLAFSGAPDAKYVIEASTNLMNWVPLGPATNDRGRVEFTDEEARESTIRFYRAAMVK
jgi:RNA polymerase sigma factor (sigma-70 family)